MADSGVYRITCLPTGRVYIGSSLSVKKRIGEHRSALRWGRHHSLLLQRTWNKYGAPAFSFEPVLYCAPEHRRFYEQALIDSYDAANPAKGMNRSAIAKGAPQTTGFKGHKHSDASRRLISDRLKGRSVWNKGLPSPTKGVPRTPEVIQKITETKRRRRMEALRAAGV